MKRENLGETPALPWRALPVKGTAHASGVADNGSLSEGFRNNDIIESAAHFAEIDIVHFSLPVEIGTDGDVIFPELDVPGDRP
jgi:hypothetical protein